MLSVHVKLKSGDCVGANVGGVGLPVGPAVGDVVGGVGLGAIHKTINSLHIEQTS